MFGGLLVIYLLIITSYYVEYFSLLRQESFMAELTELSVGIESNSSEILLRLKESNTSTGTTPDPRISALKMVFRRYDSVLYDQADVIVRIADKYGLDYRIIPSIAMHESGGCKYAPSNSYNCWGYGIYGNKITRFDSFPDAIETVTKGIKKNYIDKGLKTPEEIMQKYTPSSNGSWAKAVNFFLGRF